LEDEVYNVLLTTAAVAALSLGIAIEHELL
jgi:hypothetical protein